ncbi:MAG TPA: hypothetical protein PLL32_00850 [Anaeromyxobacteraceae bacterium]|nr:hypothetical protein [Anaeromyxobacteraceae bacterium]
MSSPPTPPSSPTAPARSPDLDEMWRSLLDGSWKSLAVVPTHDSVAVDGVLASLRALGGGSGPVEVRDGRGKEIEGGKALAEEMGKLTRSGKRVVAVVDSLLHSLAGVHVVQASDAVLLVMRIGDLDLEGLPGALDLIGPGRILGAVSSAPAD